VGRDAKLLAPGGHADGRDEVIGFLGVFQEAFPDLRLEIKRLLTDGSYAAAEGTIAETHDGVLHTPNGDVAPTGRAVELRWAAVYVTDGGVERASRRSLRDRSGLTGPVPFPSGRTRESVASIWVKGGHRMNAIQSHRRFWIAVAVLIAIVAAVVLLVAYSGGGSSGGVY
jgi:hypothetical protein